MSRRCLGACGAIVATALVACSLAPSATPTEPPAPTTPPALQAGPVADWDGAAATEVCLTVEEAYGGASGVHLPLDDWLREVLEPVGISLVQQGSQCDADLAVSIAITPQAVDYYSGTFYTGGDFALTLKLAAQSRPTLVYHDEMTVTPPDTITVVINADGTRTNAAASAAEYVESEWVRVYAAGHLLRGATRIWGPGVAVEALRLPPDGVWTSDGTISILRTGPGSGPPEPAGGEVLLETYLSWRAWLEGQPPSVARSAPTRTSHTAPIPLGDVGLAADGWSIRLTEVLVEKVVGEPNSRQINVTIDVTWNGFGPAGTREIGKIGFSSSPAGEPGPCFVASRPRLDADEVRGILEGETVSGWANCGIVPRDSVDTLLAWYEPTATSIFDPSAQDAERVWLALR